MAGGKTVSLSDDLARLLDEEVRHASAVAKVDVSRAQVVAGIIKPELLRRRAERETTTKRAKGRS